MKRLAILFLMMLSALNVNAQDSQMRMKFMGRGMDCSKATMSKHLQNRGYKVIRDQDNAIILEGAFQGYLDCRVVLREDYGILNFCRIILPSDNYGYDGWVKLYGDYTNIVGKLSGKYGEPKYDERYFDDEGKIYSDYSRMNAVGSGKCHYHSLFVSDGGYIIVTISEYKDIRIDYHDDENQKQIENCLNDEL